MTIKASDLKGAGVPQKAIYRANIPYAEVKDGVSRKDGEAYRYLLIRFALVEKYGEDGGMFEYPPQVFDRFYFRGKALERLKDLIIHTVGVMPAGDANGDIDEEEIAAMLLDQDVYLTTYLEDDENGIPQVRVGYKFASTPDKLRVKKDAVQS